MQMDSYDALGYVVELGRLASNPIDRIQWTAPAVAATVDRRVVVSPAQARKLLAAVSGLSDRGAHLEAFYTRLYYAALRPSEAVMLRESDLYLPANGWGDRPGRLRLPRRAGLDRPRHREAGTRPQAPR
jgi:integrase